MADLQNSFNNSKSRREYFLFDPPSALNLTYNLELYLL